MFHFGIEEKGYLFIGLKPKWRRRFQRLWKFLTCPRHIFKRKTKLEVAFDKALKEMTLPTEIRKLEKDKDGWVTYEEFRVVFRTRDASAWREAGDNRLPNL